MNRSQRDAMLFRLEALRAGAVTLFHDLKDIQQPFDEPRATIVSIIGKLDGAILQTQHTVTNDTDPSADQETKRQS